MSEASPRLSGDQATSAMWEKVVTPLLDAFEPGDAAELRPRDVAAWWALHRQVETRHHARRTQARFRRDPQAYLATLEEHLLKPSLPA